MKPEFDKAVLKFAIKHKALLNTFLLRNTLYIFTGNDINDKRSYYEKHIT